MYAMVQAGSMGAPFAAVRGLLGSDLLKHRPDMRVIGDPFQEGPSVVAAPAIRPDVAVFHATRADRFGNTQVSGTLRDDVMLARAARRVVVTVEEIAEKELRPAAGGTFIPAIDVDRLVLVPRGAHPTGCGKRYAPDGNHIREYLEAAAGEGTFQTYLEKYVRGPRDHGDYLSRVGLRTRRKRGRNT
jgi:glutaconate CoA-transferase subunit A